MQVKFEIKYGSAKPSGFTKAECFKNIFGNKKNNKAAQHHHGHATHTFKIKLPLLQKNKLFCITGSAAQMNAFNPADPIFFVQKKNGNAIIKLDLSDAAFPIAYKLAIFDTAQQTIIEYEPGENRVLEALHPSENISAEFSGDFLQKYLWKGAGVNIPLFSIRAEKDWGCGDLGSLKKLIDHASTCGLKLIQLLPLNDTTSTFSDKDSYPYSAISAFALHPLFLDMEKIIERLPGIPTTINDAAIKRLNEFSDVSHAAVIKLKLEVMRKAFEKEKDSFQEEKQWTGFFKRNKEWLSAYAVFCGLRDQFGTTDFYEWNENAICDENKLQQLAAPESDLYPEVLFWHYVQYQLHLQLKAAVKFAHKKGIILKADLPIGVGRYSIDTWLHPHLFNMNMQAGAPPDAFSDKGQNWKFPTYNMAEMKKDNYDWFRKRMKQISRYFDAVRIDHVLGFFRIWSIPLEYEDGRMGRFVPAVALTENDFADAGVAFNEERYCLPFTATEPTDVILLKSSDGFHFRINMQQTESYKHLPAGEKLILDNLYQQYFYELQNDLWQKEGKEKLRMLKKATGMMICAEDLGMVPDFVSHELHNAGMLSLQIQQMPNANEKKFSDTENAGYPCVVMPATHDMPPVRLWWEQNRNDAQLFFNTLLKEKGAAPYFCEPWICKKVVEMHMQSPAMWSIFLMQDLLATDGNIRRPVPAEERINDPANADQIWNYRMHINIEELIRNDSFNEMLKEMLKKNGR